MKSNLIKEKYTEEVNKKNITEMPTGVYKDDTTRVILLTGSRIFPFSFNNETLTNFVAVQRPLLGILV
jgi:hypothetical protein